MQNAAKVRCPICILVLTSEPELGGQTRLATAFPNHVCHGQRPTFHISHITQE